MAVKKNEVVIDDDDDDDDNNNNNNKGKRRRDSIDRTECRAKFYVVHDKSHDKWFVSTLELNHNLEFVSPSTVSQIQTHNYFKSC